MINGTQALTLAVSLLVAQAIQAISIQIYVTNHDVCGRGGRIEGIVTGGLGPYELVWSSGHVQTTSYIVLLEGLSAGPYSVTVTDQNTDQVVSETVQVQGLNAFPEFFADAFPNCGQPMSMLGSQFQGYSVLLPLAFMDQDVEQLHLYDDPCAWGTTLLRYDWPPGTERLMPYVDMGGCPGVMRTYATAINVLPALQVVDVQASCGNIPTGRCRVITTGTVGSGSLGDFTLRLYRANGQPVDNFSCYSGVTGFIERTFEGLSAGTYFARLEGAPPLANTPLWADLEPFGWGSDCLEEIQVVIPSNGQTCGRVQGRVYLDANSNCTRQANEIRVPATVVEILPGPYYSVTTIDGTSDPQYALTLPVGNYTITEQSTTLTQSCGGAPIPFTVTASTATVDIPTVSAVPLDVELRLSSGPARPGFELQYAIALRNLTPTNSGNITVTMQLDPALSYLSATPAPTSVSGSILTWNQSALGGFQYRAITIRTQVPANVALLGTDLVSSASVSTTVADGDLSNNTAAHTVMVTGSYDPNDKLAISSSGSSTNYDPAQDQWIDYTIRFQNTGTDTAFNVIITDTLPVNLDPGSIRIGAASHGFTWAVEGQATLKFWLLNIQLPHTGVNEPRSHGFVSFRIKPRLPLASGEQIINRANIYFDFNPPIVTDPSILTIPAPAMLLAPKVFLGGPYVSASTSMTDGLRTIGRLPLVEPYSAMGYVHMGNGGGETASPAAFLVTGNNAVVDWVVVELRNASASGTVVASRSALLQRDGDVVATNGTSPVAFAVPQASYYVSLRHRNHLGAMTAAPIALSATPAAIDFSLSTTATWGTDAQWNINSVRCLWPGDSNLDGVVKYTGLNNDRDPILQAIGGITPTNVVANVYDRRDVNLDGTISYSGSDNDRDIILQVIGGIIPTATRSQQLP